MLRDAAEVRTLIPGASSHEGSSQQIDVQVELMRVDVETVSELSAGQTVCDIWHQSSKPKNVAVAQVKNLAKHFNCLRCCSDAFLRFLPDSQL